MPVQYEFKHDIETVLSHFLDHDTVVARCEAMGETVMSCEIERVGIEVILKIEKQVENDAPRVMRKLFAASQTAREVGTWWPSDGFWRGENKIEVVGLPLVITSVSSLVPTAGGCCLTAEYFARAGFRMLNRQVEKLTVNQSRAGFLKCCDIIAEMLDERGRIVR